MKSKTSPQSEQRGLNTERESYEAPAIIYEGLITTRAGSGVLPQPPNTDPAAIFKGSDG